MKRINRFAGLITSIFLVLSLFPQSAVMVSAEEELAEKYPRSENGDFLVVENYVDKINIVSDEMLFGAYSGNRPVTESLLDYESYPALRLVENAAKNGDYDTAKYELLEYYRDIIAERPLPEQPAITDEKIALTDALKTNFLRNSNSGIVYLGKIAVGEENSEFTIDVKNNIESLISQPMVKLVAIDKDGKRVKIWNTLKFFSTQKIIAL